MRRARRTPAAHRHPRPRLRHARRLRHAPGDTLRIYEINPLVLDIASTRIHLSEGHAAPRWKSRSAMAAWCSKPSRSQQFDILVMDAFSGDSVPST